MLICRSTLSGGGIANFVFKVLFQQKPSSFSIRLLNTNCKLPEISWNPGQDDGWERRLND